MDKKRKIKCALDSIADASEARKILANATGEPCRYEDKGLQWAAELLKESLDAGNNKCGHCGQNRPQR